MFFFSLCILENVGKTTLVNALNKLKKKRTGTTLKKPDISVNTTNISTDGIDIEELIFSVKFIVKNTKDKDSQRSSTRVATKKEKVICSVWDFAGQGKVETSVNRLNDISDLYYASHQFFLSDRAIYIVVFDLRYDEDHSRVVRKRRIN